MSKSFFKSKTFWFNVVTIIVTIASVFGYAPNEQLAEETANIMLLINPLVNVVLRFYTKKEVTLTTK